MPNIEFSECKDKIFEGFNIKIKIGNWIFFETDCSEFNENNRGILIM